MTMATPNARTPTPPLPPQIRKHIDQDAVIHSVEIRPRMLAMSLVPKGHNGATVYFDPQIQVEYICDCDIEFRRDGIYKFVLHGPDGKSVQQTWSGYHCDAPARMRMMVDEIFAPMLSSVELRVTRECDSPMVSSNVADDYAKALRDRERIMAVSENKRDYASEGVNRIAIDLYEHILPHNAALEIRRNVAKR